MTPFPRSEVLLGAMHTYRKSAMILAALEEISNPKSFELIVRLNALTLQLNSHSVPVKPFLQKCRLRKSFTTLPSLLPPIQGLACLIPELPSFILNTMYQNRYSIVKFLMSLHFQELKVQLNTNNFNPMERHREFHSFDFNTHLSNVQCCFSICLYWGAKIAKKVTMHSNLLSAAPNVLVHMEHKSWKCKILQKGWQMSTKLIHRKRTLYLW